MIFKILKEKAWNIHILILKAFFDTPGTAKALQISAYGEHGGKHLKLIGSNVWNAVSDSDMTQKSLRLYCLMVRNHLQMKAL